MDPHAIQMLKLDIGTERFIVGPGLANWTLVRYWTGRLVG